MPENQIHLILSALRDRRATRRRNKLMDFPSNFGIEYVFTHFFFLFVYLQLKSSECDSNGINHSNDNLISSSDMLATKCHDTVGNKINHCGTANGSLITMTMKNNHLIVETEERSVSKRNSMDVIGEMFTQKERKTNRNASAAAASLCSCQFSDYIFLAVDRHAHKIITNTQSTRALTLRPSTQVNPICPNQHISTERTFLSRS